MARSTQAPSLSMTSNQDTPRNSATPASHKSQQQQGRAEKTQAMGAALARRLRPSTPPALFGSAGAAPVQGRQTAAGDQRQHEAQRRAARY